MKRMHIHVGSKTLEQSIAFYSAPLRHSRSRPYRLRQVDAGRSSHINFAISTRSARVGVDHLGIQVDEDSELEAFA